MSDNHDIWRYPAAAKMPAYVNEWLADVKGQNVLLDKAWRNLLKRLHNPSEAQARIISDELFNINAAAQLLRFAPTEVAEAWCQQYYASDGTNVIDNLTQDLLLQRAMGLAC